MRSRVIFLTLLVILAIMGLMHPSANAVELKLDGAGMHIGSKHFPAHDWNNRNPGIYLTGEVSGLSTSYSQWANGRWVAGTYYNSERKESFYVGRILPVFDNLDVVVGAITGYKAYAVMPMVVPSVHFRVVGNWSARIHYLPKVASDGAHVVHLSIERKF